jgi:hypothetical protein
METYPEPISGQFTLAVAPRSLTRMLLERAALMALRGPLRVLDGGNCFNAYVVAQALRRQVSQVETALGRIHLSRAFTCYQVLALLEETPPLPVATLVLDLLATFRDETVPMEERRRLLQLCLGCLRRLAQRAPLLVSVTPLGSAGDGPQPESAALGAAPRDDLLALLEEAADPVWRFAAPPPPIPLRLF